MGACEKDLWLFQWRNDIQLELSGGWRRRLNDVHLSVRMPLCQNIFSQPLLFMHKIRNKVECLKITVSSMNHPLVTPQPYAQIAAVMALLVGMAIPLRAAGVAVQQGALGIGLMMALLLLATDPEARAAFMAAVSSTSGKLIALIFLAFAITIPFSHAPLASMQIGGRTGLFILGATVLWAVLRTRKNTHRFVLTALIVTAYLLSALVLTSLLGATQIAWLFKADLTHFITPGEAYINPTVVFKAFAVTAMCLIPAMAWAGHRLSGSWRWWGYAYAPVALAVIILTFNRSALAGFIAMSVAGIAVLAITKRRHARALLATALASAAGSIAWVATKSTQQREDLITYTGQAIHVDAYLPFWLLDGHRQNIWKFVFQRFLDHPLVGNGIDQLNNLPGAHNPVPGLQSFAALVPSHPHNWVLEILAESGMIGFSAVALALGYLAWRQVRCYTQTDDAAALALFALMAGFWASALFNFSIWAVWWQLTFYVLFAIIAATRDEPAP